MGGCRCSYRNCTNTTKTRENLHFFHYPVKQKERCRQWIENAHKTEFFDLDEDRLKNKVVCQTHFEDFYFPNIQKKRLLQDAIPTLDGDCKKEDTPQPPPPPPEDMKILPANDDGTLFVLETNMLPNQFHSEKIESYIYTNNGLVLPIKRHSAEFNGKSLYSSNHEQVMLKKVNLHVSPSEEALMPLTNCDNFNSNSNSNSNELNYQLLSSVKPELHVSNVEIDLPNLSRESPTVPQYKSTFVENRDNCLEREDNSCSSRVKEIGDKYIKTIKQHSKDIAIIKRILRNRTMRRKPNNLTILNRLKNQIPPTLFSILSLHLNRPLESEQLQFFADIYSKSPDLYKLLTDKYNWILPNHCEITKTSKKNGHLNTKE